MNTRWSTEFTLKLWSSSYGCWITRFNLIFVKKPKKIIDYDSWAVKLRINKIHYNCNTTAKFRCWKYVITCFFLLWIEKWSISFQVRLSALKMIEQIHKRIGEGYMVLLPESIPFLAELMEGNRSSCLCHSKALCQPTKFSYTAPTQSHEFGFQRIKLRSCMKHLSLRVLSYVLFVEMHAAKRGTPQALSSQIVRKSISFKSKENTNNIIFNTNLTNIWERISIEIVY